ACMVPFVIIAAASADFLAAYPKAVKAAGLNSSDEISKFILFELAYGFDFLSIEFFFRGFLIIAFIKYAGMRAVIPAACFYCCIHLGKPMAEAISSFFGGLLLGILSYQTLSIWGGVLVHLGIAWLMEMAAYISYHF
ncbi:MAG: CPBP family intramembrane metalloprotease, partial [Sphingobacteriales bacterium]